MTEEIPSGVYSRNFKQLLPHWHFVRLTNYNYRELETIKDWLEMNVLGPYKRLGWGETCPYVVGVIFQEETDAFAYKLAWTDESGDGYHYSEDPLYDEDDEDVEDEEIWI